VVGGCLRPGYLPVPYVIMVLPFVGLLTARVFDLPLSRARRAGGPQPPVGAGPVCQSSPSRDSRPSTTATPTRRCDVGVGRRGGSVSEPNAGW